MSIHYLATYSKENFKHCEYAQARKMKLRLDPDKKISTVFEEGLREDLASDIPFMLRRYSDLNEILFFTGDLQEICRRYVEYREFINLFFDLNWCKTNFSRQSECGSLIYETWTWESLFDSTFAWSCILGDANTITHLSQFDITFMGNPEYWDESDYIVRRLIQSVVSHNMAEVNNHAHKLQALKTKRSKMNVLLLKLLSKGDGKPVADAMPYLIEWKKRYFKSSGYGNQLSYLAVPMMHALGLTCSDPDLAVHVLGGPDLWAEARALVEQEGRPW
jgi:hypothetical protein